MRCSAMRLLIGGSPCTHWSCAQTINREIHAEGMGWELFRNFLIAKEKFKPDYFLYENNMSASNAIKEQISKTLGVELQPIQSLLVTPQSRHRFYAHNIPNVSQPTDRGVKLSDILESGVPLRAEKTSCLDANYFKGGNLIKFRRQSSERLVVAEELVCLGESTPLKNLQGTIVDRLLKTKEATTLYIPVGVADKKGKVAFIGLMDYKAYSDVAQRPLGHRIPIEVEDTSRGVYGYEVKDGQILAGDGWHNVILDKDGIYLVRPLTVVEACRLQTLPDNYCDGATKTAALRGLGNGWTAEIIIHILSHIPVDKSTPIEVLSMYDGIGTGRYCLDKLGFTNVTYYAYEIDKNAIQIATNNYADIQEYGDAFAVRDDDWWLQR